MTTITYHHVRAALKLPDFDPLPAHGAMAPVRRPMEPDPADGPPKEAAVLILIFPEPGDGLHIVLTRRTDHLRGHSGQVSFPGGRRDKTDLSVTHTALRETCEELGICDRQRIDILGNLSPVYIPPSHFHVDPIVGAMTARPRFIPNPDEVADVFTFPLYRLLDPQTRRTEPRTFNGTQYNVPFYDVAGHKVWGATAIMLSELEHRLRRVIGV